MSNTKQSIFNKSLLYTFLQGALGAMTFGIYHQYTTMEAMRINNEQFDNKIKIEFQNMEIRFEKLLKQYKIQKLQK